MKRHYNCKLTIEQEKEIVLIYQSGITIKSIAEKYKVGRKAISGALRRQGIHKTVQESAKRYRYLDDQGEQSLVTFYEQGHTLAETAKKFGFKSVGATGRVLKRNGIVLRKRRVHYFNERAFDEILDESTHYWLGFIYADGSVNHRSLRFGLSPKDKDQLERMRTFMNGNMPIPIKEKVTSLDFYSIYLASQLQNKGIIVKRNHFELSLQHIKQKHANHFIRGYLDGDGCISVNEQVSFLGQQDILSWIRDVLHRECNASKNTIRLRPGIYEISWGGIHQARRIVTYLYKNATIWMPRKRNVAENWRCGNN